MSIQIKSWASAANKTCPSLTGTCPATPWENPSGRTDFHFNSLRPPQRTKTASVVLACSLGVLGLSASAIGAGPVWLGLPQSTAFALLGRSCGGIQEKSYATGFDPASGHPMGDVYLQTRCGGSGRGGGYRTTTYSAWVGVTWDFEGNVLAATRLPAAPAVNAGFTATDANGDQLYNTASGAYLTVPPPGAPIGVTAVQTGDQFQVTWTAALAIPTVVTYSTLTATPVESTAPVLVGTVNGSAETGLIGPLQPHTTYQITVVNATIGGSGPPSDPVTVTTATASILPSAPTGVKARWASAGATTATLVATWNAAAAGDSPIDQYQITISGSDGGGTAMQTVSGTTLSASFTVDFNPDWTVIVQAHNAIGWGPASAKFTLGGL